MGGGARWRCEQLRTWSTWSTWSAVISRTWRKLESASFFRYIPFSCSHSRARFVSRPRPLAAIADSHIRRGDLNTVSPPPPSAMLRPSCSHHRPPMRMSACSSSRRRSSAFRARTCEGGPGQRCETHHDRASAGLQRGASPHLALHQLLERPNLLLPHLRRSLPRLVLLPLALALVHQQREPTSHGEPMLAETSQC